MRGAAGNRCPYRDPLRAKRAPAETEVPRWYHEPCMEAAPAAFGLSVIGQIAITVGDVARAVAFYRDTLGIRLLFQAPPNLAFFDCGGVRLMLTPVEKPGESYSSILYFKVPDIQAAFGTLQERGVAFEQEPHLVARMPDHELWMAFFRDPNRNVLALMSEVRGDLSQDTPSSSPSPSAGTRSPT